MRLLKVIGTKVAVKKLDSVEEITASGLYIPPGVDEGNIIGTIVKLDKAGKLLDERYVYPLLHVGDVIVFRASDSYQSSVKISVEEGELYIVDANNILGVLEE